MSRRNGRKTKDKPVVEPWEPKYICQGDVHTWNWTKARRVDLKSKTYWGRWLKCRECPTKKLQTIHRTTGQVVETDYVWPHGYRKMPGQDKPPRGEIRAGFMAELPEIENPDEVWKLVSGRTQRELGKVG